MREIISYQAIDGKLFNNKKECIAYEQKYFSYRTDISVNIKFLDSNRHYIETPASTDDHYEQRLEDAYTYSSYLIIHNDLSEETIEYLYDEIGLKVPTTAGEYRYDDDDDSWIKITDEFLAFCKKWGMTTREMIKRFTP